MHSLLFPLRSVPLGHPRLRFKHENQLGTDCLNHDAPPMFLASNTVLPTRFGAEDYSQVELPLYLGNT